MIMTDILKRLRDQEMFFPDLYSEAADEIERLRQVLENAQQARVSQGKAIIDANNEIERLREALEHYASADNWMHIPGEKYQRVWLEPDTYTRDAYDGYDIARAALGGENG